MHKTPGGCPYLWLNNSTLPGLTVDNKLAFDQAVEEYIYWLSTGIHTDSVCIAPEYVNG